MELIASWLDGLEWDGTSVINENRIPEQSYRSMKRVIVSNLGLARSIYVSSMTH